MHHDIAAWSLAWSSKFYLIFIFDDCVLGRVFIHLKIRTILVVASTSHTHNYISQRHKKNNMTNIAFLEIWKCFGHSTPSILTARWYEHYLFGLPTKISSDVCKYGFTNQTTAVFIYFFIIENVNTNQIIDRNLSTNCQQTLEDAWKSITQKPNYIDTLKKHHVWIAYTDRAWIPSSFMKDEWNLKEHRHICKKSDKENNQSIIIGKKASSLCMKWNSICLFTQMCCISFVLEFVLLQMNDCIPSKYVVDVHFESGKR